MYGYGNDKEIFSGLTIEKVVSSLTEEAIFLFVIGYVPEEYEYVTNPFREDNNPGCFFKTSSKTGRLCLNDYATTKKINGVQLGHFDCIGAAQIKFGFGIHQTLKYLVDNIDSECSSIFCVNKDLTKKKSVKTIIQSRHREFNNADRRYLFNRYGITRANCIEDKTYPVTSFLITNHKGQNTVRPNTIAYEFNFESGNKKIYMPKEKLRFITNTNQNDVGGVGYLDFIREDKTLVITKSYKDYRVLKNADISECVWFQNEGCRPDNINAILEGYKRVVFFYDNDTQGKFASTSFAKDYNADYLWVPEYPRVTDPSDMYFRQGKKNLYKFLTENKLRKNE